jgi:hypothetical protein
MLTREQIMERMRVGEEQVPDEWHGHWTHLQIIEADGTPAGSLQDTVTDAENGDADALRLLGKIGEWGPDGGIAVWDDYYWVPPTWDEEWLLDLADCTCEVDWTGLRARVQNALNAETN